ncbi:MAG TPA: hypothetical protein VKY56_01715 [Chloroflexota bacterium]|nr:hypothetical protein [Chloroflexota bacterium]
MISRFWVWAALGLILLGYSFLAILYATRVPTWNAPDEPAHYNVIRSIALDHQLPILRPGDYDQTTLARLMSEHFPPGESIDGLRYESHQPPLYYLIAAPVFLATIGLGTARQVVVLRLVTAALGALLVLATFRLAQLVFPRSAAYPLAAAAFVAFLPMHLFMNAAIDNDALVELLLCLVLTALVEDLAKPHDGWGDIRIGVLVGLAALTKLDGDVAAVLVVAGFTGSALLASEPRRALRRVPLRLIRSGGAALLVSGWWFIRNMLLYGPGDPFALRRHAEVVAGQPLTGSLDLPRIRGMLLTAFHSFWGQFGWMGIPYSDRTYDVLATLSALVALGVLLHAWRIVRARGCEASGERWTLAYYRWAMGLLLLETVLVIVGVVFYNLRYLQPQGRYLFPALPALAVLAVAGIGELIRQEYAGVVLLVAGCALYWLCIFSLFQVILPAFAAS